jgi:hypothetical protein
MRAEVTTKRGGFEKSRLAAAEAQMSARLLTLLTGVAAFVAIGCGSESTPTAPTTPPPVVAPTPPTPPPPPARGHVDLSVVPNPVPYSGERISDVPACASASFQNTWFYDQILTETGGSTVTFTQRIDLFDGGRTNDRSDLSIVVPANGSLTLKTRWCSQTSVDHTAESRFSGKDAAGNEISVSSGVVRLMRKP